MRDRLRMPVYSISAGRHADGQLMICSDVLGIFQAFTPKFVKKYENLGQKTVDAFRRYGNDARKGVYSGDKHTYTMVKRRVG
jgi:3-methyl-2-oxobutanoate hydroxymethyltransferase